MWPINSTLTQDILETDFFESVERAQNGRFYPRLSTAKTVEEITTTFPSFGSVPEIRQMSGVSGGDERLAVPLKDWSVSATVFEYEQTIPIRRLVAQSKPDSVRAKTAQMAPKAMKGMDRTFCQALQSANVGYDGVALFSSAHPESGSSQDNTQGTALATNYVPTAAEAESILTAAISKLKGFLDDQGTPVNEGVSRFTVLCPVPMVFPFKRITDPSMAGFAVDASGGTGVYRGIVEVIGSAYCTTTGLTSGTLSDVFVFTMPEDSDGSALALATLADWQFNTNIGNESSDDWNNGKGYLRSWAAFAYLPWQWQHVVRDRTT